MRLTMFVRTNNFTDNKSTDELSSISTQISLFSGYSRLIERLEEEAQEKNILKSCAMSFAI